MSEEDWFGRYRIFECVGSGGMATVHRARIMQGDVELEVALKRLLPHHVEDEHFVRDFIREAKLAANLHHPNIVRVYELGRIGDTYFIAMELVRGTALTTIIRAGRPSPIGPVLAIMLELTEALDYAHDGIGGDGRRNQVIHRDLTPSNLLVTDEGNLKIIDFGVAKALTGDLATNSGFAKGKLGYMAPEQIEAIHVDGRADLYSAGIVMWELLTGGRLFQPKHDLDLHVLELVAPPPSVFNPDIPPAIDEIVMRALEKDVERRFQSAADFHRALGIAMRPYAGQATRREVRAWIESVRPRDHSDDYVGYEIASESSRLTPPSALTPLPSIPIRSHPRAERTSATGRSKRDVRSGRQRTARPPATPQVEYSRWPVQARPGQGEDDAPWPEPVTERRAPSGSSSGLPVSPPDDIVVRTPGPDEPVIAVRFRPPTVVPAAADAGPVVRFRAPTVSPVEVDRRRPGTELPPDPAPAVRFRPPTHAPALGSQPGARPPGSTTQRRSRNTALGVAPARSASQQERDARASLEDQTVATPHQEHEDDDAFAPERTQNDVERHTRQGAVEEHSRSRRGTGARSPRTNSRRDPLKPKKR